MSVPLLTGALLGIIGSMASGKGRSAQTSRQLQEPPPMLPPPVQPQAPEQPNAKPDNPATVAANEAGDKTKAAAALRAQKNDDVFTSPLGAVGGITKQKKQLLGA